MIHTWKCTSFLNFLEMSAGEVCSLRHDLGGRIRKDAAEHLRRSGEQSPLRFVLTVQEQHESSRVVREERELAANADTSCTRPLPSLFIAAD